MIAFSFPLSCRNFGGGVSGPWAVMFGITSSRSELRGSQALMWSKPAPIPTIMAEPGEGSFRLLVIGSRVFSYLSHISLVLVVYT